jgi:hypothetical protein
MSFCGIDPGLDKFGLAIADDAGAGALLFSAIAPAGEFAVAVGCLLDGDFGELSKWRIEGGKGRPVFRIERVCLGNGTGLNFFSRILDENDISYNIIDESMTTLEGRALYWKLYPPRGLWRIVPLSLRIPPRPVDDLAAWAILGRAMGAKDSALFSRE